MSECVCVRVCMNLCVSLCVHVVCMVSHVENMNKCWMNVGRLCVCVFVCAYVLHE